MNRPTMSFLRFMIGVLLPLLFALGLFYLLLQPTFGEFTVMTELMGATALLSVFAAYGAYRLGWIIRSPRIRWTLMGGYALSGLLIFLNVLVIAWKMFASHHDLMLATVLLVFASGIAMAASYFLSEALTDRIHVLNRASQQIADGDLEVRVPVSGNDEMAKLGLAFNTMVSRLQDAQAQQQELNKMRRDLIAWIGHDLRTPLTSIRAILEALADGVVEDPQTVQRYLKTAQRDIRALSMLINDLFELSQMDAGGLQLDSHPNSITDIISDTIESFSELATRQNVTLEGSVIPGVDPVNMDAARIGQVLNNLLSNALRHTPAGGRVSIRAWRGVNGLQVEVEDSGEGIQPEDLPHVFDQFYRGEKSRSRESGGSGLGLAIARGIVEAHGGRIWVESAPGQGAHFCFTLP
ncbi:MAG: cell wall metabolism sensor histidine kinase WalK [Chloroflexi bacterium]|nr:cell wall metabolism sensor histidine kinase WalK [Chloroflexota bacterium]